MCTIKYESGENCMIKKKRILFALFGIILLGCHSVTDSENQKGTYILFVTPLVDHNLWLEAKEGFMDACAVYQYHCDWIGPKTIDTNRMNDVMKTGILQKADAIITQGVVDTDIVDVAVSYGIPVILVDSDMPKSKRTAYFGKDFHYQAQLFLEDIEKNWGKDKKLIISIQVAQESFTIAKEQIQQIREVFKQHPGGFEIVSVTSSRSDVVRAKKEWAQVISDHPDINVALNFAGESAEACYEAMDHSSSNTERLIYGVDDMDETIRLIKEKKINGTITTSFYGYGYETIKYLYHYFSDPKAQRDQVIPAAIQLVTPNNVEEYINGSGQ